VPELPTDHAEQAELITVYSSRELAELAVAKSILDEAEIFYVSKGEMPMEFLAVGPVELQVGRDDAEQARGLLKDLENDRSPEDFLEPPPEEGTDQE
jgi:hypothetical protein